MFVCKLAPVAGMTLDAKRKRRKNSLRRLTKEKKKLYRPGKPKNYRLKQKNRPEQKCSTGDFTQANQDGLPKPRGLLMAISEIQRYSLAERQGKPLSKDFLTLNGEISFFGLGLTSGLLSHFVIMCLTPLSIGVMLDLVPVFGKAQADTFDKIFAMLMAVSFSLGYSIFLALTSKYYIGELTKACVKKLLQGATVGAFLKMAISVIVFHFMYFKVLTEDTLSSILLKFYPFIRYESLNATYAWLLEFKPVFLTLAYFTVFVSLIYVAIPWMSVLVFSGKIRRRMKREEKWLGTDRD